MRRFFLPLPEHMPPQAPVRFLADFIAELGSKELGIELKPETASNLIRQGSVWYGNKRVKDPLTDVNRLYVADERHQAAAKRQSGHKHPKNPPKPETNTDIGDENLHELRYGPWLQVFYPEKPITEYSLNPEQIRYQDDHLLIAYKPAMVNTCQSVFSDTNCLTWAVQKYLDQENPGHGYAVNTINRLDYATRGLVFYAKSKPAEIALHTMFMQRQIHKRYLVITPSFALPDQAEIAARTPAGATVRTSPAAEPHYWIKIQDSLEWKGKSQAASTLIRLIGRDQAGQRFFWIALPQTGRTHQIRKHFARYLAPIIGDPLYGNGQYQSSDMLMLACVGYRFRHPINGQVIKVAYFPPEMNCTT